METPDVLTALMAHADQALQFGGAFAGSLLGILGTVRATQAHARHAHERIDAHDKHAGIDTRTKVAT